MGSICVLHTESAQLTYDLGWYTGGNHLALIQKCHPLTQLLGFFQIVCGQQKCDSLLIELLSDEGIGTMLV